MYPAFFCGAGQWLLNGVDPPRFRQRWLISGFPAEACMAAAKELEKEEEAQHASQLENMDVHSDHKLQCEIGGCNTSYSLVN